jgi:hypothetical protein
LQPASASQRTGRRSREVFHDLLIRIYQYHTDACLAIAALRDWCPVGGRGFEGCLKRGACSACYISARCSFDVYCCFSFGWPGSPRQGLTFLLVQESKQRSTPCCPRPCAALRATCGARSQVGAAELTARLCRSVQTAAASQTTKHVCHLAHMPTLCSVRLGKGRRGGRRHPVPACAVCGGGKFFSAM